MFLRKYHEVDMWIHYEFQTVYQMEWPICVAMVAEIAKRSTECEINSQSGKETTPASLKDVFAGDRILEAQSISLNCNCNSFNGTFVQAKFFNGTEVARVSLPKFYVYGEKNANGTLLSDYEKRHILDHFMSAIEILAYISTVERVATQKSVSLLRNALLNYNAEEEKNKPDGAIVLTVNKHAEINLTEIVEKIQNDYWKKIQKEETDTPTTT